MRSTRVIYFMFILLFLRGGLSSRAQQPAGEASPAQPDVKGLTPRPAHPGLDPKRRMLIDALVTDRAGKPVAGLEPSDFTILDNHQPSKVLAFQRSETSAAHPEPALELIFMVDAVNVGFQDMIYFRKDLESFLTSNDGKLAQQTSIVILTDTEMKVQPKPTLDGKKLAAMLEDNHNPVHVLHGAAGYAGSLDRVSMCLRSLSQLAAYEATRPGRKVLIWIGPGWPSLALSEADRSSKDLQQVFDSIVHLSAAIREARMTVYSLDAQKLPYYQAYLKPVVSPGQAEQPDMMVQVLAVQSGGRVIPVNNSILDGIHDCLSDLSAWYTLAFASPTAGRTDEFHAIEVKVDKPGLSVHTTTGYYDEP